MKGRNIGIYGKQNIYNNNRFDIILIRIFISADEDDIYNNPNLHLEEQDELEIPNGKYSLNVLK